MESLKHRLHYFPFEKFFPSEVRFQNGNGNGDGDTEGGGGAFGPGFSGMAAGGLGSGYGPNADSDGNLSQSAPESAPEPAPELTANPQFPGRVALSEALTEPSESRFLAEAYQAQTAKAEQEAIAFEAERTNNITKAFNLIGKGIRYSLTAVPGGNLILNVAEDIFTAIAGRPLSQVLAKSIGPTPTPGSTPSTPSTPSSSPNISGFPSPGGGGEYPIVSVNGELFSTPSYVEPDLVQTEIKALAKYLSSPTEQSLTDILNQAQFAYSSDQAKEEAKKETQSAQLASILPIMGIILIGGLVAFRKGASA